MTTTLPLAGLYRSIRTRGPEWATLGAFAAIVAFAIPYHEPWADEAQAWQLARSLSLRSLFETYIRYEASPGLWHFVLWVLIRAHVTYAGLHWICGGIAVAAVALLLFRSPFPRYLKLTLPFTYFLLFQYAIIARSYVLVPLLLFAIASRWKKSAIEVSFMLGLLANVSLHAAVISGGLAVLYALDPVHKPDHTSSRGRRRQLLCALIVLGFYAFALWTAWPSHDLMSANASRVARIQSHPFLLKTLASLVLGICSPLYLSIIFWIGVALCLHSRRRLHFLLPVLLFATFSGVVTAGFWHQGLLAPLVLCLLWITWPAFGTSPNRLDFAGATALALMVVVQVIWSGYAIHFDHYNAYSPDIAAADFLKPLVERGSTVAVTYVDDGESDNQAYFAIGILPYFDHNIYVNQPDSFWWWSNKNPTEALFNSTLPSNPRIVLVEMKPRPPSNSLDMGGPRVAALYHAGYKLTNLFCGTMPRQMGHAMTTCHAVFRHSEAPQ